MTKNNLTDFEKYGFKRQDIIEILGANFFQYNDEPKELTFSHSMQCANKDDSTKNETPAPVAIEWGARFAGRKNALEIISALSIKLAEKSGNAYRRGSKVSASALAGVVASILNKPDNQQYRKLIADALKETQLADNEQT
ncbi:hypothetical protein ACT497_003004 [Salmonella enterica subsp. enterica serovar Glostrup]|nr:hypothetical protein [Salmonella enterica]EBT1696508.1 hypothetical protein [Salmonella enterica]EEG7823935.1 hypothetical protein [Salmonella enterica]EGK5852986.1 hypothetical protein [Salmonella enterica]EGW1219150.1 hypothetical protein [Salmonella enterica]